MEIKAIGNQLCQYGPSTFYKGLLFKIPQHKILKNFDAEKIVKNEENNENENKNERKTFVFGMGDCVPVRPFQSDSLIECLAEIRMIWRDKVEQTFLLSLRLYFLPENTPKGRIGHGEDEVVAVKDAESPKGRIIIRAEDFCTWLVDDLKWNWGITASFYEKPLKKLMTPSSNGIPFSSLLLNTKLNLSEVENEKDGNLHSNVTVLSYSRYCRYRATLKRLEHVENNEIRNKLIETLSGFVATQPNTRIMFVKETFDCADLDSHDSLCPHLAPKLKGKPIRGRRKPITNRLSDCSSPAPSTDSCESNDSDIFDGKHLIKNSDFLKASQRLTRNKGKSESASTEVYTTLSTGRIAKQRLPLTPLKPTSGNKRKRKADASDESPSDDDQRDDEDYDDKYVNRKVKQETELKRQNSSKEENDQGMQMLQALKMPFDTSKSPEELDFLIRLNTFIAERSSTFTKFAWELRDVNLFTIYTRVQKLGGFNAIADNRVWKNLFEDLSEPGKCITQGMTKRRYERILLPFELHEREKRENGKHLRSELTISTIPKSSVQKNLHHVHGKQRHTASPAIEIIPLKNGIVKNIEMSIEQTEYNSSNDGVSLPVHVIVRLLPNECLEPKRNLMESDKSVGQKENIPLMLQRSTTILPLTRDGIPTKIVDLVDSDDGDSRINSSDHLNLKKRKLDILREGGLEVTPISRKFQNEHHPTPFPALSRNPSLQPNVSLMSLAPARAPPVIQSLNMYQSTSQVFKNPKEEVFNVSKNLKSYCLDLTSKNQQQVFYHAQNEPRSSFNIAESNRRSKTNLMSIEEVQRNYRGSNPDLQITLVKPQIESPSSSSSKNTNTKKIRQPQASFKSKPKNVTSTSSSPQPQLPTLNPMLVAAASELQLQNMPSFFPFLSGLDITPQQSTSKSGANFDQSQATLMSYLSALYANPLLQGQNMLPNMAPAVEFLKLYNSASSNSRIPSSKN